MQNKSVIHDTDAPTTQVDNTPLQRKEPGPEPEEKTQEPEKVLTPEEKELAELEAALEKQKKAVEELRAKIEREKREKEEAKKAAEEAEREKQKEREKLQLEVERNLAISFVENVKLFGCCSAAQWMDVAPLYDKWRKKDESGRRKMMDRRLEEPARRFVWAPPPRNFLQPLSYDEICRLIKKVQPCEASKKLQKLIDSKTSESTMRYHDILLEVLNEEKEVEKQLVAAIDFQRLYPEELYPSVLTAWEAWRIVGNWYCYHDEKTYMHQVWKRYDATADGIRFRVVEEQEEFIKMLHRKGFTMKQIFELAEARVDDKTVEVFQQEWNEHYPRLPFKVEEVWDDLRRWFCVEPMRVYGLSSDGKVGAEGLPLCESGTHVGEQVSGCVHQ